MNEFSILVETYIREKQEDKNQKFCVKSWLDSASKRASQISIATHVLKYTHSDAKGSNIYAKPTPEDSSCYSSRYVTTNAINNLREDVVGNAAAMDIAGLLQLELNGINFLDYIDKNDSFPISAFAENETQLASWMNGFKSILSERKLSSHTLAKQIYFPKEEGGYHLLAPLYSSSLAQVLYDRVKKDRFEEDAKTARESKKKEKFSDFILIDYPNLGIQLFGGTKPQNISRLNSLRGGKSYLLRSAPPIWTPIKKPPIKKNAFWKSYQKNIVEELKDFKQYLWAIHNLDSNIEIRDRIKNYVNHLVDLLLIAAEEIRCMKPGWSINSEIPLYEQIFLDPLREDLKEIRDVESWKEHLSDHFASIIIKRVENKNLKLTDMNHTYLSDLCLKNLKEFEL